MIVHSQKLRIDRALSEGPDPAVFLAHDLVGGSKIVMRRTQEVWAQQPEVPLSQFRLLRTLAQSGFVDAEDLVTADGRVGGYTTAFVDAPTLTEFLLESAQLAPIVQFLRDLSLAVAYLHSLGYIHCDLKPANILVKSEEDALVPCILDLGFAVQKGTRLPTELRGTPGYLAPEVIHGDQLTEGTDVYSFGRVLLALSVCLSDDCLAGQVRQLGEACAQLMLHDRPRSFWEVYDRLDQISRRLHPDHVVPAHPLPPLRPAGINRRLDALEHRLMADALTRIGLVAGSTGTGKSTLLRECCLRAQVNGTTTFRVTEADNGDSLADVLDRLPVDSCHRPRSTGTASVLVTVEMARGASITLASLERMAQRARERDWHLLVEYRGIPPSPASREWFVFKVSPLSLRECIHATSHLVNSPSVSSVNGRAAAIATGGIPFLAAHAMAAYVRTRRRARPEPLDFDAVPQATVQYWRERLDELSSTDRSVLARASLFHRLFAANWIQVQELDPTRVQSILSHLAQDGWLVESTGQARLYLYRFAARSARNALRQMIGAGNLRFWAEGLLQDASLREQFESVNPMEMAEILRLSGGACEPPKEAALSHPPSCPEDDKLRVLLLLRVFDGMKCSLNPGRIARYRDLSIMFRRLGNPRSSKRWAVRALRSIPQFDEVTASDARSTEDIILLFDLAGDPVRKQQWLEGVIGAIPDSQPERRGLLLSELGATHLMRTDPRRALGDFRSAEVLLKQHAPDSGERARNLSRLGVAEAMTRKLDLAQRHLEEALALAQRLDLEDVIWRAVGNLGWVAWAKGDPKTALAYHRRAALQGRKNNSLVEYLLALSNIVLCLVDLGRGYGARQAARLAVELSEAVSDPVHLGHATNNLGFVLAMQGNTGAAKAWFSSAIRVREQVGDRLGAAQSQLNIARAYATARLAEIAEQLCRQSLQQFESLGDLEGTWDCNRLLARILIDAGRYEEARQYLALVLAVHSDVPAPDRVEADLLRVTTALWTADMQEAGRVLRQLQGERLAETIHGLRCEFLRAQGHWHLLQGNYDEALLALGTAAQEARRGNRTDKLIDTLVVLALLARKMRNYSVGLRYLRMAEQMVAAMQTELK
jgi:serine/threonine protein kinase/tetratricopeptide (TPR) repeat protein